jgi:glycosyltransferase involved in cell wall biosynthesis
MLFTKAHLNVVKLLERIDVIMCTYNSNKPYFHTVLQRIFEEIPVHCFIVVDRFSSDGTEAKVLEVFPKAKVIRSMENLGRARKIGIDIVDTPFFAFIDDDVVLLKGWYEHVRGLMDNRIGAVACFAKEKTRLTRGIYYYATRPRLVVSSKSNVDSQRGYTFATLMKKKAVATWKPDGTLAACEDHEILRHVVGRGFLWLTSYFVFAEHFQPDQHYFAFFREIWRKGTWNTAGGRYIQVIKLNPAQLIFTTVVMIWAGIKTSILFRNAFVSLYYFVDSFAFFYGYVCWKKKLFLHR